MLIHIVESMSANFFGQESYDYETKKDRAQLENYQTQLEEKGFKVKSELGFGKRVKSIAKIVEQQNADLLIVGAHGHKGLKDWIYGETVNAIRHEVNIPVLVINLQD